MMMRRHHRRPPWWPANEPWPPPHRSEMWRHGRGRFMRRMVAVFAAMLFLSALGLATLVSRLIAGREFGTPSAAAAIAAGILVLVALLAALRRFGLPLGNIVEAANRLGGGDYSTRVSEYGPP